MINRDIYHTLQEALNETPAVCPLGPRQTGKTTLALAIQEQRNAIYLDLESERDLSKLKEAEVYLEEPTRRLVVYPGSEKYPLSKDIEAIPLSTLCKELQDSPDPIGENPRF